MRHVERERMAGMAGVAGVVGERRERVVLEERDGGARRRRRCRGRCGCRWARGVGDDAGDGWDGWNGMEWSERNAWGGWGGWGRQAGARMGMWALRRRGVQAGG
jgi:hypothetical protein